MKNVIFGILCVVSASLYSCAFQITDKLKACGSDYQCDVEGYKCISGKCKKSCLTSSSCDLDGQKCFRGYCEPDSSSSLRACAGKAPCLPTTGANQPGRVTPPKARPLTHPSITQLIDPLPKTLDTTQTFSPKHSEVR